VIFIYSPLVPSEWNGLLLGPTITVASIMACRLVRELKLGQSSDPMTERAISKIVFNEMGEMGDVPQQRSGHAFELRSDMGTRDAGDRTTRDVKIHASREDALDDRV
jgi:hypothetical protein